MFYLRYALYVAGSVIFTCRLIEIYDARMGVIEIYDARIGVARIQFYYFYLEYSCTVPSIYRIFLLIWFENLMESIGVVSLNFCVSFDVRWFQEGNPYVPPRLTAQPTR